MSTLFNSDTCPRPTTDQDAAAPRVLDVADEPAVTLVQRNGVARHGEVLGDAVGQVGQRDAWPRVVESLSAYLHRHTLTDAYGHSCD